MKRETANLGKSKQGRGFYKKRRQDRTNAEKTESSGCFTYSKKSPAKEKGREGGSLKGGTTVATNPQRGSLNKAVKVQILSVILKKTRSTEAPACAEPERAVSPAHKKRDYRA